MLKAAWQVLKEVPFADWVLASIFLSISCLAVVSTLLTVLVVLGP